MKRKITMYSSQTASIQERFQQFLSAASANGFSERTLKMYRQHLHSISKHLDIAAPLSQLTKTDLEAMVEPMRTAGLAHNSISSYLRVFKSFLSWCKDEGYANPEGAAKTQLFKKSPSRYPWSKMQNGQQNAGHSATLEIYALLLGMGKWRGTSAKAIQGVPKGIKRTDTKKSAEKLRGSGS